MKIIVTDYDRDRKIASIRDLRRATGGDLRSTKAVIDNIDAGMGPQTVIVKNDADLNLLRDGGVVTFALDPRDDERQKIASFVASLASGMAEANTRDIVHLVSLAILGMPR